MFKLLHLLLFLLTACTLLAQTSQEVLEFAVINDTHAYGKTNDRRDAKANIEAFVNYCNSHSELQFALYGGDFFNAYSTRHDQALSYLQQSRADFDALSIPFYTTRGNHDCNGKSKRDGKLDNSQIITDAEYYELFSPLSTSNPHYHPANVVVNSERPQGNYYYVDFPNYRTRLIVLNNYDRDSLEIDGYHDYQVKWVAEQALNLEDKADAQEWSILLLAHRYFVSFTAKPLSRVLHAYVHGIDLKDSDCGIDYSAPYSQMRRGRVAAFIGGHYHEDDYQHSDDYNIITLNRGYATDDETGDDELCFSHFRLDTHRHTIEVKRIGRGRSCLYSYEPAARLLPVPAIEEPTGLGYLTTGGTSGRHITVHHLNNRGIGSLRWAVSQPGARVIEFAVSGTIHLDSPLVINQDSLTILGQTSPEGIAIEGNTIYLNASEVVMQHLTLDCELTDMPIQSQKTRTKASFDSLPRPHYVLLDHLTCLTRQRPALALRRSHEASVQHCRFLSYNDSIPAVIGGGNVCTYYDCLFDQCPRALYLPEQENNCRDVQIDHCTFTGWKDHCIYGGGRHATVTIMKNYFVPGEATTQEKILETSLDGTGRYYVKMNVLRGQEQAVNKNALIVEDHGTDDGKKSSLVVTAFRNQPFFDFRTPEEMLHGQYGDTSKEKERK